MMSYRYACPACEGDLRNHTPAVKKTPWYKLVSRHTLLCPHCGAEIEKRFADFDAGLAIGLAMLLGGGGFVSIWRLGKYLVPLVAMLFGLRMLAGGIFSLYVRVKKRN